jgi:transcriptional regulator with XRE-family HTH domain
MAEDRSRTQFAGWLSTSMSSRGLSQAQLARAVGVADTQVSRWRRGQVLPTVQYLQRIADTFGVQRTTLDRLVGFPVAEAAMPAADSDADVEAELQVLLARLRESMQRRLPRSMWRAYVDACVALADGLGSSVRQQDPDAAGSARPADDGPAADRPLGFRS